MGKKDTISSNLVRTSRKKRQLRKILIVCEGEKTEPEYFKAFPAKPEVFDSLDIIGLGYNTLSLVEKAVELKNKAEDNQNPYVEVWAVFDKDDFPWQNFCDALEIAKQNNIFCAYSIESFELWYLLHFNYTDSRISRDDYCEKLTKILKKGYKKNDPQMYSILKSKQNTAIKNASTLYTRNIINPVQTQNPITLVFKLVQRLNN